MDEEGTPDGGADEVGPIAPRANRWPGQQAAPPPSPGGPPPGWQPGWPTQPPAGVGGLGGPGSSTSPGVPGVPGAPSAPPGGWPAHVLVGDRPPPTLQSHRTRNAVLGCVAVLLVGAAVITFGVIQTNKKPKPLAYTRMAPYQEVQAVAELCKGGRALPDGPVYTRGGRDQWGVVAGDVGYGSVVPLDLHEVDANGPAPEYTKSLRIGMAMCVTGVQHLVTRQCELDVGFNQDHFAIDTSVGFDLDLIEVRTAKVLHSDHFVVTENQCPAAVRITQSGQPVDPYSDDIIADAKTRAMQLAHQYDTGR